MSETPRFSSFIELADALGDRRRHRALAQFLTGLIRHKRIDEAEILLWDFIGLLPDTGIVQTLRSFSAARLIIGGWDKLHARIRRADAGVVAIAFSGDAVGDAGARYHFDTGPLEMEERIRFECYFFNEPHPLAGNLPGMAKNLDEFGDDWLGEYDDMDVPLWVNGCAPVIGARRRAAAKGSDFDRNAMSVVSEWWLMVQIHRAIARDLAKLDFGRELPVLMTARGFGDGFASFYEATGDLHPIEFEAERPKGQEELYEAWQRTTFDLSKAHKQERKRRKREERDYLDRGGDLTASGESIVNAFKACRKGDWGEAAREGANFISNFRELYRKFDY